jgi:phosphoenolpyruvate carboxylase
MARTLSKDVHLLGDTLGEVLRAHGGDALFQHVEAMRQAAKRSREDEDDAGRQQARAQLADEASRLEPEMALEVVRAFTLYFQLINLAEDVHRTRELRRREMEQGAESIAESLAKVVGELKREGVPRQEVLSTLQEVALAFVFTSHPTEARRRTTERLLVDVREVLEDLDRRVLSPTEMRIRDRRLRAAVEALWEHGAERRQRPEVLEEVKAGLWYIRHVLLDAVPRLHRRMTHALEMHYGPMDPLELPMPISFGSWMGGDRDGNPYVTDAVIERTLELHHWIILDRYIADLDALVDPLAAVEQRLPEHPDLDDALARAAAAVPEAVMEAERRNPDEPLRRLVTYMRERIARTRTFSAGAYPNPRAFLEDLLVLRRVLERGSASGLPNHALLDLIHRVRCFGFTLARLDVREDARVHRRVVAELLRDPDYPERSDTERRQALGALQLPENRFDLSNQAQRVLGLFDTIRRSQARFGAEALQTYILSMTEGPADVLEVYRLAELYGVERILDIVFLLETRSALDSASQILEQLFSDEAYRSHLKRRHDMQELLVGYSDSMKEAGILTSRVEVLDAQRAAAATCDRYGVVLRVFHGRGGSVSRGGGPTYRAIRALPRDAFSGRMKITEQGETRAFHFGNPDLAVRYLEQTVGAALAARCEARRGAEPQREPEREMLSRLADYGHAAYRALVQDEGLVEYFQQATPLEQIGSLNIASRPAKRGGGQGLTLDDLRAIPWVFAWSQARHVLTGWFGVGSALSKIIDSEGVQALARLYEESPFFFDLLDNVQMTLAKVELPIAGRYAELCTDTSVRQRIFGQIEQEYERTRRAILQVTGQQELLDEDPVVKRSIRLRNPYVDPLSYLQVEGLRNLRQTEGEEKSRWQRVARVAVQGIAAGLRNTG